MDDLERAIRVIFAQDPSITPAVREEATRYCDGIKAHPDCWILCWERLVQTEVLEVKFWCLQVILQALSSISPAARVELRGKVLSWLREVAGKKQEEVVVKNKVALVYAGLIKLDYPAQWPAAWQDLIGLMDLGLPLVDFFLRVLAIFDQEVVNDEVARSNEDRQRGHQIKHAMRERDVVSLVECWYKILTTLKGAAPHMVRDCLKVTALYVVWIEILTVANDKFLSAVCNLIAEASDSAGEACDCLAAIVSKKMPASKKVQMLSELQIFARLEACVHRDGSDHQLLVKQADMINSVGEVTLEAYVDLRVQSDADSARLAQVAWESTNALMPLVFWVFAHKEHQVAVCVEPFLTEFFVKVKSFVADGQKGDMEMAPCHSVSLEQVRPILMQTLQLIIQRTSYPPWFQHNDPNFEDEEQHVAFIEFRRSLTKIYKRIFLVDEQLGFQFVQASVAQLTTNLSGVQPMEVDAVLYLFKEAGETVRQLEQHLQAKGPLAGCFVQLIECDALVNADHWAVQLALMEVYVKYGKLFALHQELFPRYGQKVLQALLSPRGVRSNNPHLAARACFMFGRFVKLVRVQAAALVVQIHEALQDLLIVQYVPSALLPVQAEVSLTKVAVKGALKADDQANLFEALACLAAASRPEELPAKLEMLLKGPAQNLSEIVTDAAASRAGNDIAGCAGWAGRSIEAIATVSKAFNVSHASTATAWEQVLMIVARILEKFVNQLNREIGLWRAALFLCRRMVEVLGDRFLTVLDTLFPFLYATNDQADLTELTIFAHHLVCQYQKKTQPHLQKWPKLSDVFSGSWSKNLVQRINKIEFSEVLRKYQYPGNIQKLFSELDDDRSGEITMYEIDPAQAAAFLHKAVAFSIGRSKAEVLWSSFRLWCIKTFRSVEELLTRLGNTNEERLKTRLTIKARHSAITEEQFQKRIKEMGWQHGQEKLLFSGLDCDASGKLGRESFRWLEAEFHRIQRKMEAKSRAIHSLRKQQAREAQEQTMNRFKEYLVKKHGNLVRAWRVVLCSNDVMSIPKTPFLKACALIGFSHEARDLWHVLDKDESGFAALEELDPPSAEALARFKAFLESRFGSVTQGFASLDSDSGKKVSYKQFEKSLLEWGWSGHTKQLFQHLDKSGSKMIEESDFRFLEKWHPHLYFVVEANHAAREEIRDLIGQKYGGHFLKAWRQLLDKDGSNRCSWSEFQAACHRIRYHGDVAGAWRAFDQDLSGYITLNELDSEASTTLSNFKSWAWREFGTVRAAFSVFDHDASNSLTFQEFRGNCRIYGYVGNARQLFAALDVNQEGVLSMQETCFLDDWEIDNNSQEERTHLEKRESHIRRIDDTVRKHVQKQARPERLSELSCRSHSKRSLKSDSSIGDDPEFVDESDRSSKVAQVKQTLQMRADLPLIPLYTWPHRRPAKVALLAIRDRERKHWVQEAADDWVFMGQFKELAQDMMLGEVHRPDDGGKRVALTGYLPARIPRLHQTFLRPLAVWQQMPEQSDQLKREKLELGNAMLQLLKEAAQRCPSALLEPMLTNTRHGQEMTGFLLVGLQDAREIKAVLYSASAWAALLEAATSSSEAAAAIASLPIAQLLQRMLWSAARMDYNDIQSQKVLSEAASILRSVMNPRVQPQAQLEQTKEAFQQSLVGALPGLQSEIGPRQLGEVLLQEAPLKDVRTTLQQCMLQWQRALHMVCADQGVALFWDPPASCTLATAFAMGWTFVPWLLLISRASGIDKPEGCSDEAWNFVCLGALSCADLASAGITCTGIGSLDTCSTACASPCCVTTTTTTQTVTATTVTSVTHTETSTSISETATTTHTLTETSITSTASETSTHTATETETMTTTATHTITHTITEISESTVPPSTTTEIEPAAVERLSVRAVVTDVTMYVDYIRDSRIINAYKHVMEDISGLSEHWIALQMFPGAAGNITVDYILTVPFVEGAGGELVPIVPVEQVQGKLDAVTPGTFNTMLKEKVDEATGAGTHSQKVVSFEQDTSDSGNGSVSSALRLGAPLKCSLASIIFLMLASIVGS
ncbi:PSD [Symbiodinium microadriaticum]|nr:PSD [Symbiodinium microadriaticum]